MRTTLSSPAKADTNAKEGGRGEEGRKEPLAKKGKVSRGRIINFVFPALSLSFVPDFQGHSRPTTFFLFQFATLTCKKEKEKRGRVSKVEHNTVSVMQTKKYAHVHRKLFFKVDATSKTYLHVPTCQAFFWGGEQRLNATNWRIFSFRVYNTEKLPFASTE